jgi:hypothetical protein
MTLQLLVILIMVALLLHIKLEFCLPEFGFVILLDDGVIAGCKLLTLHGNYMEKVLSHIPTKNKFLKNTFYYYQKPKKKDICVFTIIYKKKIPLVQKWFTVQYLHHSLAEAKQNCKT